MNSDLSSTSFTHKPFPLVWRNLAARVCDNQILGSLAQKTYRFAAHRAATWLSEIEGVSGIALRGGALHHPVPGVSDIDLTVFLKKDLGKTDAEKILTLRQCYQKLKRFYPMLGEILVLGPKDLRLISRTRNSLLDQLSPQQTLQGNEVPIEADPVRDSNKFTQCFRYYEAMVSEWRAASTGVARTFHETRCRRFAKKIHRVCGTPSSNSSSEGFPVLFGKAFHQLHLLAERALAEPNPSLGMNHIHMVWLNESAGIDEREDKQRFLWWMNANQKMQTRGKLVVTKQARVLVWEGIMESDALSLLFTHFLKHFKEFPGEPVLLTPAMEECRLLGMTSDSPFLCAQWATPEKQKDAAWVQRFRATLFQRIQDHFIVNYSMLPFDFMALDEPGTIRVMRETCALGMVLGNREIGEHITDSIELGRRRLPLTTRLYERLGEGKSYSFGDNELLTLALAVREEMGDFIERELLR